MNVNNTGAFNRSQKNSTTTTRGTAVPTTSTTMTTSSTSAPTTGTTITTTRTAGPMTTSSPMAAGGSSLDNLSDGQLELLQKAYPDGKIPQNIIITDGDGKTSLPTAPFNVFLRDSDGNITINSDISPEHIRFFVKSGQIPAQSIIINKDGSVQVNPNVNTNLLKGFLAEVKTATQPSMPKW